MGSVSYIISSPEWGNCTREDFLAFSTKWFASSHCWLRNVAVTRLSIVGALMYRSSTYDGVLRLSSPHRTACDHRTTRHKHAITERQQPWKIELHVPK
eukprot:6288391-Amphidinium_carterae.1